MSENTSLLTAPPGETHTVRRCFDDHEEEATADEDGILRDEEGRCYATGAYEVVD